MNPESDKNVSVFNRDAKDHSGYLYTATNRLSSNLATGRSEDVILEMAGFEGKSVLDAGCGDGHYTNRFWDRGKPASMVGIDAAGEAIAVADHHKGDRPIRYQVADAHSIPFPDNSFDLVLIQSILHHDDRPLDLITEAFRLAPRILIHEPNGNSIGLKIIEKTSRYHIEHNEKSYYSRQIRRWCRQAGGRVVSFRYAGFVPMFCPDWMARGMKFLEPLVETIPVLNSLGCSVQVIVAERDR